MSDRGVNPGLVERKFRKSSWNDYTKRTSQQHARVGMAEREARAATQSAEIASLEAMQAQRPLKPPGRS